MLRESGGERTRSNFLIGGWTCGLEVLKRVCQIGTNRIFSLIMLPRGLLERDGRGWEHRQYHLARLGRMMYLLSNRLLWLRWWNSIWRSMTILLLCKLFAICTCLGTSPRLSNVRHSSYRRGNAWAGRKAELDERYSESNAKR